MNVAVAVALHSGVVILKHHMVDVDGADSDAVGVKIGIIFTLKAGPGVAVILRDKDTLSGGCPNHIGMSAHGIH